MPAPFVEQRMFLSLWTRLRWVTGAIQLLQETRPGNSMNGSICGETPQTLTRLAGRTACCTILGMTLGARVPGALVAFTMPTTLLV